MTKKNSPTLVDRDDKALFRAAMQDVAPITASDKTILKPLKPEPVPRRKSTCEQFCEFDTDTSEFTLEIEAGDGWSFIRPGVSRQTLRRLKRGYWPIQDSLDLHGFTQEAAKRQMEAFLNGAQKRNFRCVQIIHGKGLSSKDRTPVIKNNIGNWLAQHQIVLAFCQAGPENGGGGAVMVLLKAQRLGENKK
ncbi:MAG: Smr/MutS family protein [Burkholderiales bacterium]|nr:Smr/MutS family protein [Nitrosomonas sp.]MCP5274749.1 Smr/MutS family protein [Burkholderiales bacterium]